MEPERDLLSGAQMNEIKKFKQVQRQVKVLTIVSKRKENSAYFGSMILIITVIKVDLGFCFVIIRF